MAIEAGFWICAGWVSRAEMYVNGARIDRLPVQSDMTNGRRWVRPGNDADIVSPVQVIDTATGQRFGYGGLAFTWPLHGLSPQMTNYVQATYFSPSTPTNNFFQRAWSNKLTVQTFNRATGNWEAYQTYGRFANLTSQAEPALGGYDKLQLSFTAYRLAPEGPDLEPTAEVEPELIFVDEEFTVTSVINNIGDEDTFEDVFLFYDLPPQVYFVDVNSSGNITPAYSIDGGATYSETPPGDLDDVTNVRVLYEDVIQADSSSASIVFTLTPNTVMNNVENVLRAVTEGDTDTDNNSIEFEIDIIPFDPRAIADLEMWFDAGMGVYTSGSVLAGDDDPVSEWRDSSGNIRIALGSGGSRPIYKTNEENNQPTVRFTTDNFLSISSVEILSTAYVAFFVIDATDSGATGDNQFLFDSDDLGFAHIDGNTGFDEDKVAILANGTTWSFFDTAQSGLQIYTYYNSLGVNNSYLYRDGTLVSPQDDGLGVTLESPMAIGSRSDTIDGFYEGDIYEIAIYSAPLTADDRNAVVNYLKTKYGIA